MQLLTLLTAIYVAVLVLAVAASLITIWVYLRRISARLGQVRFELEAVRDNTGSLRELLDPLGVAPGKIADALANANDTLRHADERLGALADRAGARQFR